MIGDCGTVKNEPVKSLRIHLDFHVNTISVNYHKVTAFNQRDGSNYI